jgi:hypothetical protein
VRVVRALCGLALVAVLGACTDEPAAPAGGGSKPSVPASAPAWSEPSDYSFVVERRCEGKPSLGKYKVVVAAGAVATVERVDGKTASGEEEIEVPSLGGLLELAQTAADDGGQMSTSVDPVDGHPVAVSFDVSEGAQEGQTCFLISEYTPGS